MRRQTRAKLQKIRVRRWQPQDFTFRSMTEHDNPFSLHFASNVKGPNGVEFSTLGFSDGNGTWKVRVSPNTVGEWSLLTHSEDPQLDSKTVEFSCVQNANPLIHGGLLVDHDHPYHFVHEDGTRFFLMGYECDWLWALDMGSPNLPTLSPFLDKLMAHGFNYILMTAYAHDCPWSKGRTSSDDYGPPPMYPWEGNNEQPVHSRFNLAYWRHYDNVVQALHRRGISAHIMIKVYNKMVNWPEKGSKEDDLYFRWLIARYAPYSNVVWDFSKEAWREPDLEYKLNRLRLIRRHDPYHRLVTSHDDDAPYDSGTYSSLVDFQSDQQHSDWHQTILRQRNQNRWPVANVEFGYEHGPKGLSDRTYEVVQPPEEVCRRAWEICMGGGYVTYYYTYTAWDVIRPQDTPRGYTYFSLLREFFEGTEYWLMKPAEELVSGGYCLANPGKEYVVFLNQPSSFTLRIEEASGPLRSGWYHPFTGERIGALELKKGTTALTPPASWVGTPIAFHVWAQGPSVARSNAQVSRQPQLDEREAIDQPSHTSLIYVENLRT